jgi:dihydropyrimidinase/dihydroorotase
MESKEKRDGKHGVKYFLPMTLHGEVYKNQISMQRLVDVCAENKARRWGLYHRKGALVEGADADMMMVDLEKSAVVDEFYHTREPGYSTFHSRELMDLPTHTIVGSEVAVVDGILLADPGGRDYLPGASRESRPGPRPNLYRRRASGN